MKSKSYITLFCLKDTDTLKLVMDQIHQPVTLFLPTDATMSTLAQEQKDFLYAMHNRDQLAEYLRYHIVRDTKVGLYSVCWFFGRSMAVLMMTEIQCWLP